MWSTTRHPRSFKHDKRGVSSVIVIVLSLVILVTITSNVIMWSYQMNQLDWKKMQESLRIVDVANVNTTYSSWLTAQSEYEVNVGSRVNGTYLTTKTIDNNGEVFQEEERPPTYRLDINGTFLIDLSDYPPLLIKTIEVQIRFSAVSDSEKYYVKAHNWTNNEYSDLGFNDTRGCTPSNTWDYYSVNFTDKWDSYVQDNGVIVLKFHDEQNDPFCTSVMIDFMGVRVVAYGVAFNLRNNGSLTTHVVSLWIVTPEAHRHFNVDLFLNTGENLTYLLGGVQLQGGLFHIKAVTERGNTAVYSPS